MKRIIFSLFTVLLSCSAWAEFVSIDGIYYFLDEETKEATVRSANNSSNIVIPPSVVYSDVTYSVTCINGLAFFNRSSLTSIEIPNSVISIGEEAFRGCSSLTSIVIPSSVTSIGNKAFHNTAWYNNQPDGVVYAGKFAYTYKGTMPENTSIVLKDGIIGIVDLAFVDCDGLTSIEIPNSVTNIGSSAFLRCSGLTSIEIPNSVTSIGDYAFKDCTNLISVTINSNSIASNKYPFSLNLGTKFGNQVKEYILGEEVTGIGDYAFYGCSGLTSIVISNSVTSIGNHAFYGCKGLTSIVIPNSVTSIGLGAFGDCTGLTSVKINSNSIVSKSYLSSHDLRIQFGDQVKEYILGENVTTIGEGAFAYCDGLTSIEIPYSITSIGAGAFYGCTDLTSVKITDIAAWCNIQFGNETVNPLYYAHDLYLNGEKVTNLVIPEGVTNISDYAFSGCSGMTSVVIPNSVTTIGKSAFFDCRNLESVVIGEGVLSIGGSVFSYGDVQPAKVIWLTNTPPDGYRGAAGVVNYVANEQYVELSNKKVYKYLSSMFEVDGVRYVPVSPSERTCDVIDVLYTPSVTNVSVGQSVSYRGIEMKVQSINPYAFYKDPYIENINLSFDGDIGDSAFYGCTGVQTVTVANKGAIGSNAFANIPGTFDAIVHNQGTIGTSAFSGCSSMKSVEIGNKVVDIQNGAFSGCSGLTSITIPNSVTSIGDWAFEKCSGLTSIEIPNSVTYIGYMAFNSCSGLTSFPIPSGVTNIGYGALSGCSGLTSLEVSNDNTVYDSRNGCNAIIKTASNELIAGCKNTLIPDGVTSIAQYAFSGISSLPLVKIPQSVKNIGNFAFQNCTALKTVIMEEDSGAGKVLSLGNNNSAPLFADCPLDSVFIGRNISYYNDEASGYSPFYRNTSLRSVVITNKKTEIPANEFYGCTNLESVQLGDGITIIGDWAFSGCFKLDYFAFGKNVETIGKEAFSDCTNVTKINSRANTPPVCGMQALDDINKWNCTLYVPSDYITAYQQADQWKEFFFIVPADVQDDTENSIADNYITIHTNTTGGYAAIGWHLTNLHFLFFDSEYKYIDVEYFTSHISKVVIDNIEYNYMGDSLSDYGYDLTVEHTIMVFFDTQLTTISNLFYNMYNIDVLDMSHFNASSLEAMDNCVGGMVSLTTWVLPADLDITRCAKNAVTTLDNTALTHVYCPTNRLDDYKSFFINTDTRVYNCLEANNSYYSANQPSNQTTEIENVKIAEESTPVAYFDMNGREIPIPQKGMNIVKYANGKTEKIVIK